MDGFVIANIQPGLCNRPISVRVCRLWNYRGGLEGGPVKLIHMVLIDKEGNRISAMVPASILALYLEVLYEGLICTVANFFVRCRQNILNAVNEPLMIVFTELTTLRQLCAEENNFPKWIYHLTPLDRLPPANDTPKYFVDVLGVITGISPVHCYNVPGIVETICKRHVLLPDSNAHKVMITLWGDAANRFEGEAVRLLGQQKNVAIIFVGTTVRFYNDSKQLAGGSACTWYTSEDIHEIDLLSSECRRPFSQIISLPIAQETVLQQQHAVPIRNIPLSCLLNFNFYERLEAQFVCTVKISMFLPGQEWCAAICRRCNRLTVPDTTSPAQLNIYRCSRANCQCTSAKLMYRLCLIGTDITGEAEFIVLGATARSIVAVSPYEIVGSNYQGPFPISNMCVAASQIGHTTTEFSHICSMVCKFVVRISPGSFQGRRPSFVVNSVQSYKLPVISS